MIKIKKFRTRLSIPIFLSIVFFGLIATAIGSIYTYNTVLNREKEDLLLHLESSSQQLGSTFQSIINTNEDISANNLFQDYLLTDYHNQDYSEDINNRIEAYFVNTKIESLFILDKTGNIKYSSNSTQDSVISDNLYYKSFTNNKSCVESYFEDNAKKVFYYFSSPILDNNETIGLVIAKIDSDYVHSYLKLESLDYDNEIMFVDRGGIILYASDESKEYHSLGKSTDANMTDFKYGDIIKPSLGYDVLQDYINKDSKQPKSYDFYNENTNKSEIIAISNVGSCPFYVIYEINKDTFVYSTLKLALVLGGTIVLCASLALFIILFVLDRSIKPLKVLETSAKKIGEGNFNTKIDVKTDDEFKNLAEVIMEMESDLKDIYANLEVKVKEKTADLAKFEMAVASTSEHIVITDSKGIILFANEAVSKITGFSNKEVIGKKVGTKELWGGQMSQDFYKKLWDTICKHKKPFAGVISNKRKDGTQYMASAIISPILDENNEVIYIVATERDITKEVEVDKAKTEFVSLASHQLRTPLSAINWYTEMILSGDAGKVTSEQKKYLDEIYKGNKRMVDLVNSLLNVSRLDLGTFEIDPKPTVIHEVCADVFEEMEHTIKEKKQKLEIHCPSDTLKVNVDPKLMRIIIQNLISNAVKYTPDGGTIAVGLKYDKNDEKNTYTITVSDSGYGIPKNQQPKIFEKLFRADNVRAMDTEGTGLGLYIVKAILDEAGGNISFKSVEDKGTTFIVTLPKDGMKQKTGTKKIN